MSCNLPMNDIEKIQGRIAFMDEPGMKYSRMLMQQPELYGSTRDSDLSFWAAGVIEYRVNPDKPMYRDMHERMASYNSYPNDLLHDMHRADDGRGMFSASQLDAMYTTQRGRDQARFARGG